MIVGRYTLGSFFTGAAPSGPTVAEASPVQTTLPTSAYGQTIPILYGKARTPGAYVWSPTLFVEVTATGGDTGFVNIPQETSTKALLTARVRFGRPLVPDSEWGLRRLWASGKLIYDAAQGYRAPGLTFRFYDGRSTQGRDPAQVVEEGESNVSAHRGYIDLVIEDYDIAGLGAPPVFEAEVIQDATSSVDVDEFTAFSSDSIDTFPAPNWATGEFYGITYTDPMLLRRFSIGGLREVYSIPISGLGRSYGLIEEELRYIPSMDRILGVGFVSGGSGGAYPLLVDPVTGVPVAEATLAIAPAGQFLNTSGVAMIGDSGILVAASYNVGYLSVYRFTASEIAQVGISGTSWDSRGLPESITPGEIREGEADLWICAGTKLYKLVVTSSGLQKSITEHATFADNPIYAVWHDEDVIVWTDNAEVIRVDGSTGSTVWTESVPYQINASAELRGIAPADMQRLTNEVYMQESDNYNFTNLDTGETRSISKTSAAAFRHAYDGPTGTVITTDNSAEPARTTFDAVGDGTQRNLSDFLEALMVYGGGYDPSQIVVEGVDDLIQGAVFDVNGGVREIARSICEPYSIAMFERAGQIILKRAATDGSFALDATLSASDFRDQI